MPSSNNFGARAAVALPGAGSHAGFARAAFGPALDSAGIPLTCPDPDPYRVIASYTTALERAAGHAGPILIAGISIGAAVALNWAARHPGQVSAVLAAMPAWTGAPGDAPAAASARHTAAMLRADGLDTVTARMRAASPDWLGATLSDSWAALWPGLPHALDEAAEYHAPDTALLSSLTIPVGIVTAAGDAVHPHQVGVQWQQALPKAGLRSLPLEQIGTHPGLLGYAAWDALPR